MARKFLHFAHQYSFLADYDCNSVGLVEHLFLNANICLFSRSNASWGGSVCPLDHATFVLPTNFESPFKTSAVTYTLQHILITVGIAFCFELSFQCVRERQIVCI